MGRQSEYLIERSWEPQPALILRHLSRSFTKSRSQYQKTKKFSAAPRRHPRANRIVQRSCCTDKSTKAKDTHIPTKKAAEGQYHFVPGHTPHTTTASLNLRKFLFCEMSLAILSASLDA